MGRVGVDHSRLRVNDARVPIVMIRHHHMTSVPVMAMTMIVALSMMPFQGITHDIPAVIAILGIIPGLRSGDAAHADDGGKRETQ